MKKKSIFAIIMILGVIIFIIFFSNFQNDIPDKELVYQQLLLDGKDEEFVLSQFKRCTREELVQAWGNPDGMLSGLYGDTWVMTENETIIVYYSDDSIVEHVKLLSSEESN